MARFTVGLVDLVDTAYLVPTLPTPSEALEHARRAFEGTRQLIVTVSSSGGKRSTRREPFVTEATIGRRATFIEGWDPAT